MEGNIQESYCQPGQEMGFETMEPRLKISRMAKNETEVVLPLYYSVFGCA